MASLTDRARTWAASIQPDPSPESQDLAELLTQLADERDAAPTTAAARIADAMERIERAMTTPTATLGLG